MASGELTRRWIVAGWGVPVLLFLMYQGGWFLGGFLAGAAALSAAETYGLARARGIHPFAPAGILAAAVLVLAVVTDPTLEALSRWGWLTLVVVGLFSLVATVWMRGVDGHPLEASAVTLLGVVYAGGTLAFAVLIRHLPELGDGLSHPLEGTLMLAFPFAVTWLGDSGAYFVGRAWGKRKLIPSVSPKKTVEGSIGGLLGAMLGAVLMSFLGLAAVPGYGMSPLVAAAAGLLIGLVAQAGDLTESVLKRQAGVKDSGSFLPGHGGALDRLDAIFLTVPLTYFLFLLMRVLG